MANIARMIAAVGALGGGYAKGQQIARENAWEDEERVQKRKKWADEQALRTALSGGGEDRNAPILTAGATDMADVLGGTQPRSAQIQTIQNVTAGDSDPAQATDAAQTAGSDSRVAATVKDQGIAVPLDRTAAAAYYRRKAPIVIDAYLKQGNVDGAKKFRDFITSEEGRNYTEQWAKGARKLTIGDYDSALADWQNLYNQQLYDDGHTVKLTPSQDGKQVQVDHFDKDGKRVKSLTQPIDVYARQAGMVLAPEKLVEMRARAEEARTHEGALLDRQIQLETMRQEGQQNREDRRDDRLDTRLEAQSEMLDKRLGAGGGLTVAQQRTNDSIEAARIKMKGMSQPDVVKKSQPGGREYDQEIARIYRLANTRKYGEDPSHDAYSSGAQQNNAATPIQKATAALAADPAMAGYRLGERTLKGFKVYDSNGKHVGYFGK